MTGASRVVVTLALANALAASCAPVRYVLPGAGPVEDAFNDAMCTQAALMTVPRSELPWVGRHHYLSTGDALGVLLVVMLDQAAVGVERGRVRDQCLMAIGYREVR